MISVRVNFSARCKERDGSRFRIRVWDSVRRIKVKERVRTKDHLTVMCCVSFRMSIR